MAVQLKPSVGSGTRSDFMISDAAMSQRLAEIDAEQAAQMAQFAKILNAGVGKSGDTGAEANVGADAGSAGLTAEDAFALNDVKRAIRELQSDDEKFESALNVLDAELRRRAASADDGKSEDGVFCNKRTGEILPNDPHELAKMVVEGRLDVKDIPDELMTPELMNAIIALMIERRTNGGKLPEDEEEPEDTFDPAVAAVNEQKLNREASAQMLRELYGIIEKHNEKQSEDKETILDGISEPIDENEVLPSIATEDTRAENEESVFEEILDGIAESVNEDAKQAAKPDEAVLETPVSAITDEPAFPTESAAQAVQTAQTGQTSQTSQPAQLIEADEVQVRAVREVGVHGVSEETDKAVQEQTAPVTQPAQTEEAAATQETAFKNVVTVSEAQTDAAVQTDAAPVIADANTAETAPKAVEVRSTGLADVRADAEAAEQVQTAAQSEQPNGAQTQFAGAAAEVKQTAGSEDSDIAEEFKSVAEAILVKDGSALKPEKAKTARREFTSNDPASRVKNASEELEMLKSAKLSKAKGAENSENGSNEVSLGESAHLLMTDQPIVFKRADGTEIEVRPSEIVDQAAKLVQKAVEEAREQSEYSLILNPEELGRITVKLIKSAEGTVSVTIAAENARTQRILEQHSELMQNNLRSNGVDLESWQTVAESRQETYAQDYNGSSKNPYFRRDDARQSDEEHGDNTFAELIASM